MNKKHERTLEAIFKIPVQSNVIWKDCKKLLEALGSCDFRRRRIASQDFLNGVKSVLHRPHPQKETDKGALVSLRKFLDNAGIKPKGSKKP